MMTRQELIARPEEKLSKACAALIGVAVGDSFGDASRKPENQLRYGITTDFNKGASWSTDDTEFCLLVAKELIECGGNLTTEVVVDHWMRHVATLDELKRGGASEHEASINLRRGLRPPLSGRFNTFHNSDGAAMRMTPVGVLCAGDPERAKEMARIDAEISHDQDGLWGAQAVAVAVSLAMVDAEIDEILDAALHTFPEGSWSRHNMELAFSIIERQNYDFASSWMKLHDALWTSSHATVAEAIVSAFSVLKLIREKDFRTMTIFAGNFGRDADTIGAVVGGIMGAKCGLAAIPEHWVNKVRRPTGTCLPFAAGVDILDYGEKLAALIV
jgi:ADP-ribosylglycohydrolase